MIQSMTGYGKSQYYFNHRNYSIEMRSLNSKNIDTSLRLPSQYKSRDLDIRKMLAKNVIRGKVDFYLQIESVDSNKMYRINAHVVKAYQNELLEINSGVDEGRLLQIAMRLPEVLSNEEEEVTEEEWIAFLQGFQKAYEQFLDFRVTEGKSLENEFETQIHVIEDLLSQVDPYLEERNQKLEIKLKQALDNTDVDYDEQRFHQELMFYLERWDVSEEQVRLKQHLDYFLETLKNKEVSKGKLLGFISQEIGREINTLGSKANQSDIQKIVVQMKDSLEKIKEQIYNVL